MTLSPPTIVTWLTSSALAGLVIAAKYFGVSSQIPTIGPMVGDHMFETLLVAYALLWIGTVFNRI